jgi:hypothetical protein
VNTSNPECARGLDVLKRFAARAGFAAGLGLAVTVMGAGTANAGPSPAINCPGTVQAGHSSTATLAGWPEGRTVSVYLDPVAVIGRPNNAPALTTITIDKTLAATTTQYFYLPIPPLPAGHHELTATDGGAQVLGHSTPECSFTVT